MRPTVSGADQDNEKAGDDEGVEHCEKAGRAEPMPVGHEEIGDEDEEEAGGGGTADTACIRDSSFCKVWSFSEFSESMMSTLEPRLNSWILSGADSVRKFVKFSIRFNRRAAGTLPSGF